MVLALTPKQAGRNLGIFETNKLASTHLAGALMAFYVDIEFTGRTCTTTSFSLPFYYFSQLLSSFLVICNLLLLCNLCLTLWCLRAIGSSSFYDKFTHRYHIASLLKYLWTIPDYHVSIAIAASDPATFLKFVNALVNDAIFLLDESLSKLSDIRNYQIEMQDRATWVQQEAVPPPSPVSRACRVVRRVCCVGAHVVCCGIDWMPLNDKTVRRKRGQSASSTSAAWNGRSRLICCWAMRPSTCCTTSPPTSSTHS